MTCHRALLALLCVSIFGCGGRLIDEQGQPTSLGAAADAGSDAAPAVDDRTGCQVVEVIASAPSGGGPTVYTTQLSDPALEATRAFIDSTPSGMFTVTCLAGTTVRLKATFGPYTGFAKYDLPVGALEVSGKKSDRPCTVDISSGIDGALRGFVGCPTEPYSEGNVFARSGPPVGLGAFDAKVR